MIKFTLKCDSGHHFESWFQSAAAYDRLITAGAVTCMDCGSPKVDKALMAPAVASGRAAATPQDAAPPIATPASDRDEALQALRKAVEEKSDYVGLKFASEARAMHDGERPHRPIYGEARPDEARALIEDGVPVAPLPFVPKRHTH